MNKTEIADILRAAMALPFEPKKGPTGGCGRVYVCVYGDRATVRDFAAACKAHGLTWIGRGGGSIANSLYVGYDNADGGALARGEVIAAHLKANGISCYSDAHAD